MSCRPLSRRGFGFSFAAGVLCALLGRCEPAAGAEDAYLHYLRTAPEYQRAGVAPEKLGTRWNTWVYMPWRYQWTIGTGEAGLAFCREHGINGGFTDHGAGPFAWLAQGKFLFYNDHTAAKGFLHLRGAPQKSNFVPYQRDAREIRRGTDGPQPLDAALRAKLKKTVAQYVGQVQPHVGRVAYALDDEPSWGAFVTPIPWRINDDDDAYAAWLAHYYGCEAKPYFVTPDDMRKQLAGPLGKIDLSPLLDRLSYNDSVWANLLGELVETANEVDPTTPCGIVGAQSPNAWGGYDYAKLMKKLQFMEAYNLACSNEVVRSLNPGNRLPSVTTHFHSNERGTANDVWQAWYYFAHGNRGMIGWVEGWFDGDKPRPWLAEFAPTLRELSQTQGPKLNAARWLHDGVAVYYSQPSIQVSWCLDAEAHGGTWIHRGSDHRLGTSHLVRQAWDYLLADAGLQYNFIAYDDVARDGVPVEYKVLILPACYALSDIEAERIREFCRRGGTVIADFACGLFDQHGKARGKGALDDLFGVAHDGSEQPADFFGPRLWVETDQDAAFSYGRYEQLFATVPATLRDGFAVAERRLVEPKAQTHGLGKAVYLNLSPQRYLQYREQGKATAAMRNRFLDPAFQGGANPWLTVGGEGGKRLANLEATYWSAGGRTWVFVFQNAAVTGSALGDGGAEGLVKQKLPLAVEFVLPMRDVRDERTGKSLGDGQQFTFDFNTVEAVFFSFAGPLPEIK